MRLNLEDLRGAQFELLSQNATGTYDTNTPVDERSYIGTVDEHPGAISCGILQDDGQFRGAIYFDRGATWSTLANAVTSTRALNYAADTFSAYSYSATSSVTAGQAGNKIYAFDLAIDAEYEYHTRAGGSSIAKTFELIEYGICLNRAIYMRDTLMRPYLGRIIIRTDETQDPYTGLSGGTYLNALRSEWNTNQTSANRDIVSGITPDKVGGGLAYVGVIGTSNAYSVNDSGNAGLFDVVFRHEMGHNWGSGHFVGGSPEGAGLMGGNQPARFTGFEAYRVLSHRDNRIAAGGILDDEGIFTSTEIPPYASMDTATLTHGPGASININVLANDHDANGQTISINSYDSVSNNGGTITQSGQNLVYSPQNNHLGSDWFKYTIIDSNGNTATGVVAIYTSAPNTLKAYLPLNETSGTVINNTADLNSPAAAQNGAIVGTTGKFANAVTLDGDNDKIALDLIGINSNTMTFSAWIKRPDELQKGYSGIIFNGGGLNFGTNNELRYHWDNSRAWAWNSGLTPPADQWVFVALVIEPTKSTIYMHDGTTLQSATNNVANSLHTFAGTTNIGASPHRSDRNYKGEIDDVRIYDKAFSQNEILTLVNGGTAENPSPYNGASETTASTLTWTPGAAAVTHQVYFGTDATAVANATTTSPEYLGSTSSPSWTPTIVSNTTYFWRVDSVGNSTTIKGNVWNFTGDSIAPVTILNHSFEAPSTGGAPTSWTITSAPTANLGVAPGGSDGSQFLYLGPGVEITQDLDHKLKSTESLQLQFDASRSTLGGTTYPRNIQLLAKHNGVYELMAESTELIGSSAWDTVTLDYTVHPQFSGKMLTLRIKNGVSWNEFDNFRIVSAGGINLPPTASDATFSTPENTNPGTAVGTVTATDLGDTLSYSITAGNSDNLFSINSTNGAISTNASLDHEAVDQHTLTVTVTDSEDDFDTATVTINVTDVTNDDTDNDNIDDAWEINNFSNLTTATNTSDADADGQTDLSEHLAGTSPSSAVDTLKITELQPTSSNATIKWSAKSGKSYKVLYSYNLDDWFDVTTNQTSASDTEMSYLDSDSTRAAASKVFYRVEVE